MSRTGRQMPRLVALFWKYRHTKAQRPHTCLWEVETKCEFSVLLPFQFNENAPAKNFAEGYCSDSVQK